MYKKDEAKLYYLYMMSDGEVSDSENKLFDEICKELNMNEYDKRRVKEECGRISEEMTCIEALKKNTEEKGAAESYGFMISNENLHLPSPGMDEVTVNIIWNLLNIGYSSFRFSKEKREVVDHLRKYLKFPDSIYREMIDVVETREALEKHKLWLDRFSYIDSKKEKFNQNNKDLEYIQEMISAIISEVGF